MAGRSGLVWSAAIGIVLLGAGGYFGFPLAFGVSVATVVVKLSPIVQSVVASGRVETPARVEIGSQITGVVATILVDEGGVVEAGSVLMTLEDSVARAELELAVASTRQAEVKLAQIRDVSLPSAQRALDEAVANRNNAKSQYDRLMLLDRRGFTTRVQLDEAQRALDVAQAQVQTATIQVSNNTVGGGDRSLAEAALQMANASQNSASAKLAQTIIKAPTAGIVILRAAEVGAVVQPGKALLTIAPKGPTRLVLAIDERNLGALAIGQPAVASAEAYQKATFLAKVATIDPAVDATHGSVVVKLTVDEPPAYLREDMTVSVDIEVMRHDNALVLPANGVRDIDGAEPNVLKVVDGHARRTPVTIGARSAAAIEILTGVAEGDLVVPTSVLNVVDGTRVRTHTP